MKTINLALKRVYFNEILSGEKKEEYHAFTGYYLDRLTVRNEDGSFIAFRKVDDLHFFCGKYPKASEIIVEVKEICLNPEMPWEKRTEENSEFVMVLGNILEKKNC